MKKFISMAIAFAMASIMSVSAFAANSPTATTPSAKPTTTTTTAGTSKPVSKVVLVTKDQATISWSAVNGAKSYQIFKQVKGTNQFILIGTTKGLSFTDKDVKAGNCTYKIRAIFGDYEDAEVQLVGVMDFKAKPKAKAPKIKAKKKLKVTIKKKIANATGYQIKYSLKKNMKKAKTKYLASNKKTLTIKKLKSGKKYYIRVRAYQTINGKKYYGNWSKVIKKTVR